MQLLIDCPHCGASQGAPSDPNDYDWATGCSLGGLTEIDCENCGEVIRLEAQGAIIDVEVLDV